MRFNHAKWIPFGSVAEITASELWRNIESTEVQIIDVRTSTEWKISAIQGSKNISITLFSETAVRALGFDKEKPVVAICLTAHRSIPAVRVLQEMGFTDVKQLQGGMTQWWIQKFPCCKN
jgi:rhodanese-related sulfurtransferase